MGNLTSYLAAQTSTWVSSCIPQACQSYDVPACSFLLFRLNKNVICHWKWGAGQAMSDQDWWRQNSGITDRAGEKKLKDRVGQKKSYRPRWSKKSSEIALLKKKAHRSRWWWKRLREVYDCGLISFISYLSPSWRTSTKQKDDTHVVLSPNY